MEIPLAVDTEDWFDDGLAAGVVGVAGPGR
jgi:hypothetical protein